MFFSSKKPGKGSDAAEEISDATLRAGLVAGAEGAINVNVNVHKDGGKVRGRARVTYSARVFVTARWLPGHRPGSNMLVSSQHSSHFACTSVPFHPPHSARTAARPRSPSLRCWTW